VLPAFRDPSQPFADRAEDLIARLTAEEKIAMLHQRSPAVPRLDIAEFWTGTEGVHGASWRDHMGTGKVLPATVFPQPVGLAASWDLDLVQQVGRGTAREVRALHAKDPLISLNVWAPVVNLLRDPRWGRNEEGYSEDPLLSAAMATAFCRGLVGDIPGRYLLTAPTLKHFLGYNNEEYRDLTSSMLRERVLHEYDLPPFEEPVKAGLATGVMPSYNLVNGRPAHVSPLLRQIRGWTDDELLIISDAWAPSNLARTEHYFDDHPQAHAAALKAGLDSFTDQGADGDFAAVQVTEALGRELVTMAEVDRAVRRKLLIRLRLGEFDPDGGPYAAAAAMDTPEHRDLARAAAGQSMVLLKNDNQLLPISPGQRIAVLGPLADTLYEDWYSPALPYQVTIADGLANVATMITVDEAADRVRTDLGDFDVFDWGDDIITLRQVGTGKYLTVTAAGELAATAERPDGWEVRETFHRAALPDGAMLLTATATATQNAYRLRWDVRTDGIRDAVARAREADIAVVVVGNDPKIGGRETHDRTSLALPPSMVRLVRDVSAANPRTILVIMSSYPYLAPDAPAIVWTCHAGQETGHALADLLTGRTPPQGRLPQTWYASDDDLPDPLDYDIIKAGWTYQYSAAAPRFPFGHGLTYTTFAYGDLRLGDGVAALDVSNTGVRSGTEVVQLYARYAGTDRPRRRLCGFARVTLAPGQTRTVEIPLPPGRLALWDVAAGRLVVPPGEIEILAGASSADIRQTATLTVPVAVPGAVPAAAPGPRDLAGQAAAAFDDYENIVLVDATLQDGDAVTPANPADRSWLLFRNILFSERPFSERTVDLAVRVACADPGGGRIEAWRADGEFLGAVTVPCTGGRYNWTVVSAPLTPAVVGTGDLRLVLHGPVRLDWFSIGDW
jgi:beta-glucosidase